MYLFIDYLQNALI